MHREEIKQVVESLLFVYNHPLSLENIGRIVGNEVGKKAIREAVEELVAEYGGMGRSFHLVEVAKGHSPED